MIKVLNTPKLSKNFTLSEFVCPDGNREVIIIDELVKRLQALRDVLEKPVRLVSGYRSKSYNKKIGGAKNSQHLYGNAADIKVSGIHPADVAKAAELVGFRGIGIYTHNGNNFTHVDLRGKTTYWKDSKSGKLVNMKMIEGYTKEYSLPKTTDTIIIEKERLIEKQVQVIKRHEERFKSVFELAQKILNLKGKENDHAE